MKPNPSPLTTVLAEGAALLLAALFAYTAVSKVYDWSGTRMAMYNQVFPIWIADIILYVLPLVELGVAVLLLVPGWRKIGLLLSVILLSLFTGYITLVWLGLTERVPCSCGGVLSSLGWGEHLVFNLVFLGMAVWGLRHRDAQRKCEIHREVGG
ncbi:putative membrane protein YphA (DoxX/SURF4 family) [Algoriphagus sp. 4150]|uniref:MauE/DoxX family redox-associated membrane protein n=1 Tax=Algoriphagus sp. 4150 TaxID=2817756 RepID=UPI002866A116|nr:MauE/DoxX family redox-associated membrane protein [Algoriphagus sp. 4150]MDR7128105.1 putative membrane protein YphA (DoxX/SURF4 family) [Algoriphagus sp. 4150]